MTDTASNDQDKYVTYALAMRLLGVGSTTMTRLITTGALPVKEHPLDKRKKLIRLSDISKIQELGWLPDSSVHRTVTTWTIYALVDPRDHTIRYVGRTIRAKQRLQQHLQEVGVNEKKSQWLEELNQLGMIPKME